MDNLYNSNPIPITFLMPAYNEEDRIKHCLEHAIRWADEIVIVNKSSTDRTKEICLSYGSKVRVVDIPFCPKGHESSVANVRYSSNDWIFFGTASEIPTFELIQHARQILLKTRGELDLIYVPRKIYSFGIHSPLSPWSLSYYPFLINRRKAVVCETIHGNFTPSNPDNTSVIPFSDNSCVYHFTHPTAKQYLLDMMQYFEAEAADCPDPAEKIMACFRNIGLCEERLREGGAELLGHYCAWPIYWLGTILYIWEKQRSVDVPELYARLRDEVLRKEWLEHAPEAQSISGISTAPHGERIAHPEDDEVPMKLWDTHRSVRSEDDLLLELNGRPLCEEIRVLYIIGAHRFQERDTLFKLFPNLEKCYLFEPIPQFHLYLEELTKDDGRIEVFPYAIGDRDWETQFFITDNDGASSSLLHLGKHRELFPHVHEVKSIPVACRTLDTVIREHGLRTPDMLFIDVQGAEYKVLTSLSPSLRARIRLIYTEASTEEIYIDARLLEDVKQLLRTDYHFLGFAPLHDGVPTHGNALFVHRSHAAMIDRVDTRRETSALETSSYLVSAVVSTYNAERFMRGCLEDLELQTIADRLEIIVIDSGSQENERAIVNEFQQRHSNIVYIRTEECESLYAAWNRGIKAARGKYITNANTDDRHRRDALEKMVQVLESKTDIALVYADVAVTDKENQSFDSLPTIGALLWPDFDPWSLFLSCYAGPQPMWRKELHERYGYFDDSFKSGGDYELWLRMARKEKFHHIPEILGLYLFSGSGIELRDPQLSFQESIESRQRHWPPEWEQLTDYFVNYTLPAPKGYVLKPEECEALRPLVSIVLITRSHPANLGATLKSLAAQAFHSFEVILIDGSDQYALETIASFRQQMCIQHMLFPDGLKCSLKRNRGLKIARGKYVAYLDDQTVLHPDHVRTLVDFLEVTHYKAAYTDARGIQEEVRNGEHRITKKELHHSVNFDSDLLMTMNFIPTPCVMHEKSCLNEAGYFDEDLETDEDWDQWKRMSRKFKFAHIKKITAEFIGKAD